jgi:hypothetical protein
VTTETGPVKLHDVDHRRGKAELDNNVPEGEVTLTLVAKLPSRGSPGAARIDFDGDEHQVVRSPPAPALFVSVGSTLA